MAHKRSSVETFLAELSIEPSLSKKSTRLELARAKNRRNVIQQSMQKTKERIRNMVEKLRELEESCVAINQDIKRMEGLLGE